MRRSADGGQGCDCVVNGRCHNGLQLTLGVYSRVRRGGANGGYHSRQVIGSHPGNANGIQICQRHRSDVSRATSGGSNHTRRRVSHGLQFGHSVHCSRSAGINCAVQQVKCIAWGGNTRHTSHANGGVLRARQRGAGVGRRAISAGQHGVVGVDDGLHLARRVSGCAVDCSAVERAIDGGQVA